MQWIILSMLYQSDASFNRHQFRDSQMEKNREFEKNSKGIPFGPNFKSRSCSSIPFLVAID